MRVQKLEGICRNLCGVKPKDKSYLRKGDKQLTQTSWLLRDYGVSANDLLVFHKKRSRGKGKNAPGRVRRSIAWSFSSNRQQRLELIWMFRNLWAALPPVEFETEEGVPPEKLVLPMTAKHHDLLEQASSELLELDERSQEESSAAPVASSSLETQPEHGCHDDDDASTDDSSTDAADTREDTSREAAPAATRRSDNAPLRGFVAGGVEAAAGSRIIVSYNKADQFFSFRNDDDTTKTLLPAMNAEELGEKYGLGFKLLKGCGYTPGQGAGRDSCGIATPLPSGDILQTRKERMGIGISTDTAELTRLVNSASIDPPRCEECKEHRWPAYRTIRKGKWTCKKCAQNDSPQCAKCLITTWNGYNAPFGSLFPQKFRGKWLCAACWTPSPEIDHHSWGEWFTRRAERYPEVFEEWLLKALKTLWKRARVASEPKWCDPVSRYVMRKAACLLIYFIKFGSRGRLPVEGIRDEKTFGTLCLETPISLAMSLSSLSPFCDFCMLVFSCCV